MIERVREDGLIAPGRPLVVLYSGGRDSTCLLDLAVRIAGAEVIYPLHVNYGLRDSADADERHCLERCRQLGVELVVERPLRPETGNLQAWARDVRYGAAAAMAIEKHADVAAGHTATDQVETILYRLASSPSRRALLGMRPREGSLVRPLLAFTRDETAAYCVERGLTWREDETNDLDTFARSRIRQELVPALRRVHPGAERNLLALLETLRDEATALDAIVADALAGASRIELGRLRQMAPALRRLIVQRLADDAAGGLAPGAARRADELLGLSEQGTVSLDIGNGVRAVVEYGLLRFEPATDALEAPGAVSLPVPGRVRFGEFEVRCEIVPPTREAGVLDRAELGSELLVRSWRPGDRMSPIGLGGTKSLQDLFTARRVPRGRRPGIAVVESGGEIAWVAGVATSERFKVTDTTREAAHLTVESLRGGAAAAT